MLRGDGADVLLGDDEVVPPHQALALLGLGHVAVEPDGVGVEFGHASPFEAREGLATSDGYALALLVVVGDALLGQVGLELVVGPGARRREALALVAYDPAFRVAVEFAVDPVGLLAVGVPDVVHLDHDFQADPLLLGNGRQVHADLEGVAPGLALRRASAHVLPVGVGVPPGEVPGLHLGDPTLVPLRTHPRPSHGPRLRRVVAPETAAVMVDGRVVLVELHVETEKQLVIAVAPVIILQPAIEGATTGVPLGASDHPS